MHFGNIACTKQIDDICLMHTPTPRGAYPKIFMGVGCCECIHNRLKIGIIPPCKKVEAFEVYLQTGNDPAAMLFTMQIRQ